MSGLDVIICAVVGVLGVRGLFRGFVREAFAVLAWAGGLAISFLYAAELAPYVARELDVGPPFDRAIAGVAIFLGAYVVIQLVGWILHRLVHAIFLGPVDRVAGLLLGAAKGAVLCGLFLWIAALRFGPEVRERVADSPIAAAVLQTTEGVIAELSPPPEEKPKETKNPQETKS